jgi:hypothetical protein
MSDPKERLVRIMGTFDLATGHADTLDELLDSLESELRDVLGHYREALKQHLTQEPVAMLERDPSIGRLRVTYEDCITELETGTYPLYVQPQGWRDNVAQAYLKGYDEGFATRGKQPTKIFGPDLEGILNSAGFYKCSPEWVGLTRKEKMEIINRLNGEDMIYALDEVERILKEKNHE